MSSHGKIWFRRRRFGWGWSPATKEGWAVLLAYLLVILACKSALSHHGPALPVAVVVATLGLIAICYARGEAPGWRWGDN
ncbi:MAG: hypothetical protein KGH96_18210 [Sphingomonadales bacterium]|nr:hypothetical protein [Sphingomonadales bacterium]